MSCHVCGLIDKHTKNCTRRGLNAWFPVPGGTVVNGAMQDFQIYQDAAETLRRSARMAAWDDVPMIARPAWGEPDNHTITVSYRANAANTLYLDGLTGEWQRALDANHLYHDFYGLPFDAYPRRVEETEPGWEDLTVVQRRLARVRKMKEERADRLYFMATGRPRPPAGGPVQYERRHREQLRNQPLRRT